MASGTTGVRRAIRWGLLHGLLRRGVTNGAKRGDLLSQLLIDPVLIADPIPAYDTVRSRGRLVDNGFILAAVDHDLCTAILRSPDFGVVGGPGSRVPPALRFAARLAGPGPLGPVQAPSMLAVDPPDHTRYRKLVTRAFTARAVAALRTRTEEIATELLDTMESRGGAADLIHDYAALLPSIVIAEMLGAPVELREQFLKWGDAGAKSLDPGLAYREFRVSERGIAEFQDWMAGHVDHIRRNPGDNILSALVHAHDEEGRLSETELLSIAMLVLAAGFETTVNLIGNGTALLTAHPDQLAVLRAEPQHWSTAVDEVLRFDSPVQRTGRIALRDTEVCGERVAAGRIVVTMLAGANRDPAVFTDPHRFDVTRANAGDHIAFSSGIHYCLGAGLARMEGEVGLRALFERFPDLALSAPPRRRTTRVLRGYDAMPVRLSPATVGA